MKKKYYIAPNLEFENIEVEDGFLKDSWPPSFNEGNAAGDSGEGTGTASGGGDGEGGDAAAKQNNHFYFDVDW